MNKLYLLSIVLTLSCSQIQNNIKHIKHVKIVSPQVLGDNGKVFDIIIQENFISYQGFKNINPQGKFSFKLKNKELRDIMISLYNDSFELIKKKRDVNYIQISFEKEVRYIHFGSQSLRILFKLIQEHHI